MNLANFLWRSDVLRMRAGGKADKHIYSEEELLRIASQPAQKTRMVSNVISEAQARYIPFEAGLEAFLRKKWPSTQDFKIQVARLLSSAVRALRKQHKNERWCFEAPGEVSKVSRSKSPNNMNSRHAGRNSVRAQMCYGTSQLTLTGN